MIGCRWDLNVLYLSLNAAIRLCITMKASMYFAILPREQGNTVLHIVCSSR